MAAKFFENPSRSIVKSITFRVLILTSDGIIVFLLTHEYKLALTIVIVRNLAGIFIYYFHERLWNTVRWGRMQNKK